MPHDDGALTLSTYPALRFEAETLDRIARLEAPSEGVLSAYLDVEPAKAQREGFEAALLDLWKPLRPQFRETDMAMRLEVEIERVNAYVRSWEEPPGRAVAMFTSEPSGMFVPVALDVPVVAGARFGPRPYLLPLIAALDEYERYAVALVDRERARIVTVWMDRIEERVEFKDALPGRVIGGGWLTAGGQRTRRDMSPMGPGRVRSDEAGYARHLDYHIHLHVQRVVDELWRLNRKHAFDRLIIGGPPEALAALRQALPRSLAQKVAGRFAGELFAADAQVVARVREIEEGAERAHEAARVREILEAAQKGGLAVIGWDETLAALCDGRVHQLVLVEGDATSGYACADGHFATIEAVEQCPFCTEAMWPVSELAVWATRTAMATGASVEFVRGEAAELLRPHGAGAVLRYR